MNKQELKIITFNANGVYNDHATLQELIYRENIDIALVQETKIPKWFQWRIRGYKIYNTPGPNPAHGGTAVIVRSNIKHCQATIPKLEHLQATAIIIELQKEETLIGSLYQSPSKTITANDLNIVTKMKPKFMLGGDMNAKHTMWNSRLISPKGRTLAKNAEDNGYYITGPLKPTYFPLRINANPDVLDIFLYNLNIAVFHIETLDELNSDHSPVLIILNLALDRTFLKGRQENHVNWKHFTNNLKTLNLPEEPITNEEDLDNAIDTFSNTITAAKREATYKTNKKNDRHLPHVSGCSKYIIN